MRYDAGVAQIKNAADAKSAPRVSSSKEKHGGTAQRPFAVFDIDGTLIRWQLYHVVVARLAKQGALGASAQEKLRNAMMAWKRREQPDAYKAYEAKLVDIYEEALTNIPPKQFDDLVQDVIAEYKDQVYVYTRGLVKALQGQGYTLLIISGSHHELVQEIGKYYSFDDWVGSRYDRRGESFTGEKFVANQDKKQVLHELVEKHGLDYAGSIGVGDSGSDIAMLEAVEQPIAFNPDKVLLDAAKKHGWKIVVERKSIAYQLEQKDGTYRLTETNP